MIDFNHTKQYTLSIRLSTDGFCFAVHNPSAEEQYAYMPYDIDPMMSLTANLKKAIQETEMLRHTYAKVNIIVADTAYTLVPKEYYASSYERELYLQNFPQTKESTVVLHNLVAEEQVAVLFGMEQQLHQFITERYPKAQLYASIGPLIDFGAEKSYASAQRYCLVQIHKRHIDLLCLANGAPIFVNSFKTRETADTLYFLLNCWQMLDLSQTDDTMHLIGTSRHAKTLVKELERFIREIHIIRPAEEFHSTELARTGEMPFDLQALIACE